MLNVKVNREEIIEILSNSVTLLEKKPTLDILQNVYIYTSQNKLFIEATDLEIYLREQLDCEVINEGTILINGKTFINLLKSINFKEINLISDENYKLSISSDESKNSYKLSGISSESYPKFIFNDPDNKITLDSKLISEMIEKVLKTIANDPNRQVLNGVLMELEKKNGTSIIRLVSSDGHRLNLVENEIQENNINDLQIVIPKKGIQELKKIINKYDNFQFGIEGKDLYAITEDVILKIRLIDLKYPNYRSIIPENFNYKIKCDRLSLIETLERISIISSSGTFQGFKLISSNGFINLSSIESQIGEINEELQAETNDCDITIAFNEEFFLDTLNIMKSNIVNIHLNDSESVCLITGDDDPGFFSYIMPISLSE